ncbi:MAG: CoA-acylating methylmalonate-semialdehyde dehydrogenase [Gemmatimonadetes bacterium]|nr:CoA-acylating methylmalonate-semialdehyde dehydrogenase [Gemmatimonadota bacterium]MBK7785861.1 CoA-acylating methylmalonate-semialdehyde dehydrogenase [Gemmatimonadota bacterium]
MKYPDVRHYLGGQFTPGGPRLQDVHNPADGSVLARVPLGDRSTVEAAVQAARAAFPGWSRTPIKERVQVFFRYKALLERHLRELSALITEEHGKIAGEADAEILKAIELTEFACSLPQLVAGEVLEVSRGVECRLERYPLGVVAAVNPFNFPSMVPHWTIPNAIALGNTFILKPSEVVPLSAARIAELLKEAGLPDGVFNIVHGDREVVEALCDHPAVEAVTFVGSTRVAQAVYRRATSNLKRALCLGGAKNHVIVMPDADPEMAAGGVLAAMAGCTGQRCMAASVMVAVSATDHIVQQLAAQARQMVTGRDVGPVITAAAKARIEGYITEAEQQGATVLVDGRGATVPGKAGGWYVGPTVIDHVRPEMKIAQEEVFGPVLAIVRTPDLEQALAVENASPYGNACSIFTESGGAARAAMERASAGMVGVNVGVPVPREPFGFGGWNDSRFGVGDITGKSSLEFWTKTKKITTKWNREAGTNWMSR